MSCRSRGHTRLQVWNNTCTRAPNVLLEPDQELIVTAPVPGFMTLLRGLTRSKFCVTTP